MKSPSAYAVDFTTRRRGEQTAQDLSFKTDQVNWLFHLP
jgi:hypothetical protein